jgi:predicted ATPase/DNA-binding CsgD family transcriptional regulator
MTPLLRIGSAKPPLCSVRVMQAVVSRLPTYESSFVAREGEIAEVLALLADHRLVSVCGVGGSGKTRLAVEAASRLDRGQPDWDPTDVLWAALGEVDHASLVPQAIAESLAVPSAAGSRPTEALCGALAGAHAVLVLDNCEQVAAGCRDLLAPLLRAAPGLRILLTSRVPLELDAERVYPIPPLDLAGAASELFVDRAAAVAPVYALTAANRRPIAEICARLDGLPLAIELAASRIRVLAPRDLLHELEKNLGVLSSTESALAERHHSMEAVLATSWQSLGQEERTALAGLATFVGGFSASAAAAVAGATVELLNTFVDRALVQAVLTDPSGQPRYQLHELVRSYATREFLAADPRGADLLRERHLDYYVALARELRQHWNHNQVVDRRSPLWAERANIDAAMGWAVERGDSDRALRLVGALYFVWDRYSWSSQAAKRERLERMLALPWAPVDRASILARAGALVTCGYGWTTSDTTRAHARFEEALRWYRDLGHPSGTAWAHAALAWQHLTDGDLATARRHALDSLAGFRAIGHRSGEAETLGDLGQIALAAACWTEAEAMIAQSMTMSDELGDIHGTYRCHLMLADLRRLTRRWTEAIGEYDRALRLQREAGFSDLGADMLEGLGEVAAQMGQLKLAAELVAAGLAWRHHFDVPRGSFHEASYAAAAASVQDCLGTEVWIRTQKAAALLSRADIEEATAAAIVRLGSTLERLHRGLSERELQVLQLLAQGLNNAGIAEQLVLSQRTVEAHLRSIFTKLGVTSRTAAAREAVRLSIA